MSDEPSTPEEHVPFARPAAPETSAVGQARAIAFGVPAAVQPHPMHLAATAKRDVWADLGILLLLLVACDLTIGFVAGGFLLLGEDPDKRMLQVYVLPFRGAAWVAVVVGILRARAQRADSVGLTRRRLLVDAPLGLAVWGMAFITYLMGGLLLYFLWRSGFQALTDNVDRIEEMLPRIHPLVLVLVMGVVAFYEELVFRGFLLTRLRRAFGSWWPAGAVSSALFAVPHALDQEPVAMVPLFMLGCLFCAVTIWRKSLVPAMIGHALYNSGTVVYLYYTSTNWQ
ncbi:MAG: lysostaphin resistance A-like protein [Planctomycetota bacterium]|jgi:membrane protease YdiL (CAAX protease family)